MPKETHSSNRELDWIVKQQIQSLTIGVFLAEIDHQGKLSFSTSIRIESFDKNLDKDDYDYHSADWFKAKVYELLELVWNGMYASMQAESVEEFHDSLQSIYLELSRESWHDSLSFFEGMPLFHLTIEGKEASTIDNITMYAYNLRILVMPKWGSLG